MKPRRARLPRSAPFAALAALVHCAGHRAAVSPAPATRTANASPDAPWSVQLLPRAARWSPVRRCDASHAVAGAEGFVQGVWRYLSRAGALEVAHDAPLRPVVTCARLEGEAWLFVMEDGSAARADTFLGPLTRVGDAGGAALVRGFQGAGAAAALDTQGALWVATREGVRRAAVPGDARELTAAAFADARTGLVLTVPGMAWLTRNGGASFEPYDAGETGLLDVSMGATRLTLASSTDAPHAPPAGAVAEVLAGPDPRAPEALTPSPRGTEYALLTRSPARRALALASRSVALSDGAIVNLISNHTGAPRQRLVVLARDGAVTEADAPADGCALHAWNAQVLVVCRTADARGVTLYAGLPPFTAAWRTVGTVPGASGEDLLAAPDSPLIVRREACDPAASSREDGHHQQPVCWFDGSTWRDASITGSPASARGFELLTQSLGSREAGPNAWRVSFSPTATRTTPLVLSGPVFSLGWAAPGVVGGALLREQGARASFVGPMGGPFAVHPLPEGALNAGFASPTRGLAAGRNAGALWSTSDGGAHWVPLATGDAVEPHNQSLWLECGDGPSEGRFPCEMGNLLMPTIRCEADYCLAHDGLLWASSSFLGPHLALTGSSVAPAERAERGARHPAEQLLATPRVGSVTCTAAVTPPPPPRAPVPLHDIITDMFGAGRPAAGPPAALPFGAAATGFAASFTAAPGGATSAGQYAVQWRGAPGAGRVTLAAQSTALEAVPGSLRRPTSLERVASSPRSILLERCAGTSEVPVCDLLFARAGGALRAIAFDAPFHRGPHRVLADGPAHVVAALALPDGGWLVQVRQLGNDSGHAASEYYAVGQLDRVLTLDAQGAVTAARSFAWTEGRVGSRLLALRAGREPGLLAHEATGPTSARWRFYTLDARDAGASFEGPSNVIAPLCTAPTTPGATLAVGTTWPYALDPQLPEGEQLFAPGASVSTVLEGAGNAWCVRESRMRGRLAQRDDAGDVRVSARGSSALVETLAGGAVRVSSCAYQPPR